MGFLFHLYWLIQEGTKSEVVRLINTVHDSIVLEVKESELDWLSMAVKAAVKSTEREYELRVPLTIETEIGNTWS
jgi:DNA polymerase I-like protein with 3'-5' exonuclease and polymerase domains